MQTMQRIPSFSNLVPRKQGISNTNFYEPKLNGDGCIRTPNTSNMGLIRHEGYVISVRGLHNATYGTEHEEGEEEDDDIFSQADLSLASKPQAPPRLSSQHTFANYTPGARMVSYGDNDDDHDDDDDDDDDDEKSVAHSADEGEDDVDDNVAVPKTSAHTQHTFAKYITSTTRILSCDDEETLVHTAEEDEDNDNREEDEEDEDGTITKTSAHTFGLLSLPSQHTFAKYSSQNRMLPGDDESFAQSADEDELLPTVSVHTFAKFVVKDQQGNDTFVGENNEDIATTSKHTFASFTLGTDRSIDQSHYLTETDEDDNSASGSDYYYYYDDDDPASLYRQDTFLSTGDVTEFPHEMNGKGKVKEQVTETTSKRAEANMVATATKSETITAVTSTTTSTTTSSTTPKTPTVQSDEEGWDELDIEVVPGVYKRLRSSRDTFEAYKAGKCIKTVCFVCSVHLLCIPDCEGVICPLCLSMSPLETSAIVREGTVGMGIEAQ